MVVVSDSRARARPLTRVLSWLAVVVAGLAIWWGSSRQMSAQDLSLPSTPLHYGFFTVQFATGGTFTLDGEGMTFKGTWKRTGATVEIVGPGARDGCDRPGRYAFSMTGTRVSLDVIGDDPCVMRRMVLDHSSWLPVGEHDTLPERTIARTAAAGVPALPKPSSDRGSWPSFRGPHASGIVEGQHLPDRWDPVTGENVLWRTPIPGLAHSSPIVWGDRVFVTTAVSSNPAATFKPGLYGDGDASEDRSKQKWTIFAIDKRTGKTLWERVAYEGEPLNKRHVKSTYASATPATDGRIVVAWFGSQGVYAYDVNGAFRWKVDLGRVNMGAYDIPSYEWGPASSPIIWNGLVIIQCDTQADSFVMALRADTGEVAWKTARDEYPSWGTPTVATLGGQLQLVTNASKYIRGYDPRTGAELWRLGGSSLITAPTPIFDEDLIVVVSGRGPERPIFVIHPAARGDLTLPEGKTSSDAIAWSRTGRGSYMPTPLIYHGVLYVLGNGGVFDAYDLKTGAEIYRQRLSTIGDGYSASPVASDGKIYLSNEDGDMTVVEAGREFKALATNSMGDLLMATPALSDGVMYVRTAKSLFAIGRK
jgi:outer membrane protein assembly factor BamB